MLYLIHFMHDGEGPDEMNTRLIGPLPGDYLLSWIEPGDLILEPVSFDDWIAEKVSLDDL